MLVKHLFPDYASKCRHRVQLMGGPYNHLITNLLQMLNNKYYWVIDSVIPKKVADIFRTRCRRMKQRGIRQEENVDNDKKHQNDDYDDGGGGGASRRRPAAAQLGSRVRRIQLRRGGGRHQLSSLRRASCAEGGDPGRRSGDADCREATLSGGGDGCDGGRVSQAGVRVDGGRSDGRRHGGGRQTRHGRRSRRRRRHRRKTQIGHPKNTNQPSATVTHIHKHHNIHQ